MSPPYASHFVRVWVGVWHNLMILTLEPSPLESDCLAHMSTVCPGMQISCPSLSGIHCFIIGLTNLSVPHLPYPSTELLLLLVEIAQVVPRGCLVPSLGPLPVLPLG